jgi:hypothetical protein
MLIVSRDAEREVGFELSFPSLTFEFSHSQQRRGERCQLLKIQSAAGRRPPAEASEAVLLVLVLSLEVARSGVVCLPGAERPGDRRPRPLICLKFVLTLFLGKH